MKQYARLQNGQVIEIIDAFYVNGVEVPLRERFVPELAEQFVPYDAAKAPTPPEPPAPTAEEVLTERDARLAAAALRMAPLQDAVDLGDATGAEETALTAWKQYRVKLNRIELQSGFPAAVVWPVAPQ